MIEETPSPPGPPHPTLGGQKQWGLERVEGESERWGGGGRGLVRMLKG